MKYYAYDKNSDLHHLGKQASKFAAKNAARDLFGERSVHTATILSESEIMASAVTARLMATVTIKPNKPSPIRVSAMNNNHGNLSSNQFIVNDGMGTTCFQSYNTTIARQDPAGNITLDEKHWDFSRTTSRYLNQFLGEIKDATRKKVESGEYALADLN
jgi:hypothetical protein